MDGQATLVSLGAVGAGLSALESGGVDAALILEPLWSSRKGRYQVAFDLAELPPMSQMMGYTHTLQADAMHNNMIAMMSGGMMGDTQFHRPGTMMGFGSGSLLGVKPLSVDQVTRAVSDYLAKYKASDFQDEESLERYSTLLRETTEIADKQIKRVVLVVVPPNEAD